MNVTVPPTLDGERADKVVAELLELSRTKARRLIDEGLVTFGGDPVEAKQRLPQGATLHVVGTIEEASLQPEEAPFRVVYEDAHLAVVDKPAGLVVHPGAGSPGVTLAAGLLHRYPQVEGVGEPDRWGIVHRLDRDTSGLLVVAFDQETLRSLQEALRRRAIHRSYLALVNGGFEAPLGTVDAPIGRDARRPTRRAVDLSGRPARTHYRRLAGWADPQVSLLDVRLETGRTHQIRVHLASIGHPIVGDRTYGTAGPDGVDPGRVWLHAAKLRFVHPKTGQTLELEAPLPADLTASLRRLGSPNTGDYPKKILAAS